MPIRPSAHAAALVVLAGSAQALAAGPFPVSIELSALDGTDGFVLNGIDASDRSGVSVSSAGDVNGDGVDDVIIGASSADPNGRSNAGESYVVFGGPGVGAGGSLDLSSLDGTNGFVLNGIDASDSSGVSVSSAGDVNGDGVDDVIIGAYLADPNGQVRAPARATWSSAGRASARAGRWTSRP
jgi:2C-methyl-D-erythritol 2,4-cyclodiphosphate synthase